MLGAWSFVGNLLVMMADDMLNVKVGYVALQYRVNPDMCQYAISE